MNRIDCILMLVAAICLSSACQHNNTLDSIVNSNSNLSNLYNEYKNDKQKRESLLILVRNSRCSDITLLHLDSLKENIDIAYKRWTTTGWSKQYKHSLFQEHVLPMTIANEPLEYYWRDDIHKYIRLSDSINNIKDAAQIINRQIIINTSPDSYGNPQLGYTKTMKGVYGKCDDRAILTAMALRSYSIPAAFDYIPYWGSVNNGHSVCSAILPNDSILVFQSHNNKENVFMAQKCPKVYRKMSSIQDNTLLYKNKDRESIPLLFSDFKYQDVTALHSIGVDDVEVKMNGRCDSKIGYLSVFHPQQWMPIAYSEIKASLTTFKNIGNGLDSKGRNPFLGDNIGEGILYLPSYYVNGCVVPASDPFVLSKEGKEDIVFDTDNLESVVLTRKYPLLKRIKNYAKQMTKGLFEVANKADFSDAKIVYTIKNTPKSQLQRVSSSLKGQYKYVRYRKLRGVFSIAELKIFNTEGGELNGKLIGTKELLNESNLANVIDGDPLTYYSLDGGLDAWVGVELPMPSEIGTLEFAPRNDDNAVSAGDDYELFYWDREWRSLGRQRATTSSLEFNNVPKGALLWLRNMTRGREERPFTYINGEQIWW